MRREYISIWRRPITRTVPGHADARLVVAVDVGAHGQLGLVLARSRAARGSARRRRSASRAARDRAGDRARLDAVAVDAHVHLGRGADQVLRLAEVDAGSRRARDCARAGGGTARTARRGHASENVWPGTTSNRSPRVNEASRATRTIAAYSPGAWSHGRGARAVATYGAVLAVARAGPRSSGRRPRTRSDGAWRPRAGGRRSRARPGR